MTVPRLVSDMEQIALLRGDLEGAGYHVDGLVAALGPVAAAALHREQAIPARLALAQDDRPVAVLARLFTLGEAVDAEQVGLALPRLGVDGARRLGLVTAFAGAVRGCFDLRPYGDEDHTWWLVSDLSEMSGARPLPPDHVLGVGGASTTLAAWTPRRPFGRALDLGTGCGVQSLHLAQHCHDVVATDLSERALMVARFNALLNEQKWELRAGSMLEPVQGERFDLIVSNPPFVITPRRADIPLYEYRDGGVPGDAITSSLVRAIGDHLRPAGIAQLLGNWELGVGQDWRDVVGGWVAGTGLDAWVVQRESSDPAEYAELWIRDGGHQNGSVEYAAWYEAWLGDFAARGIESVGFGVITLQRPHDGREPFIDLIDHRGPVAAPMGPSIDAGLRARSWLASQQDRDLLARHWRLAPDVTQERYYAPNDPEPRVILLRQGGGLGQALSVDSVAAAFAGVCDGELSADQAAVAIAVLTEADPDDVRAQVIALLRSAAPDGLLTVADSPQ